MISIFIYMNKFTGKLFIANSSNEPIPLNKYTIYSMVVPSSLITIILLLFLYSIFYKNKIENKILF